MARRRLRFIAGDLLETKLVQRAGLVPVRLKFFRGLLVDRSVPGDVLRRIRATGQARERARRLKPVQYHHTQLRRLAIMTLRPEAIGIYEAPRREADEIRVRGVGRDLFEPRSVRIALTERPTDDEIRSMHNWMRGWKL